MPGLLDRVAQHIRRHPALLKAARASVFLIPDIQMTVPVSPLGSLRIRLRRHRWFLYQDFRSSDSVMIAIYSRLVKPDDVVYDIGANIGVYTRYVIQECRASAVIAFEPMAGNLELLLANVKLGNIEQRTTVLPIALSDRDGDEDLQIDDVTSGTAVLNSISGGSASQGRQHHGLPPMVERVTVRRLDSLLAEGSIPPPGMMKIDTEGAEALVLSGAIQTLRTHRPRLAIALHGEEKALATLNVLQEAGYVAFGAVRAGDELKYQRLSPADAGRIGNNNIIAVANESEGVQPIRELLTR